jgi:hypothetical protein
MDYTVADSNNSDNDSFQELLEQLPGITKITAGKRGSGRKVTNNIGAHILGVKVLEDFRKNHAIDLSVPGNLIGNYLFGLIDNASFGLAKQLASKVEPSYKPTGILAVAIVQDENKDIVLGRWKGTIVNSTLTFKRVWSKGKDYRFGVNPDGIYSFWRTDDNGKMYPYIIEGTLVNFDEFLNAIVDMEEIPVSFPDEDVSKMRGLAEILANVNVNFTTQSTDADANADAEIEDVEIEDVDFEEVEE